MAEELKRCCFSITARSKTHPKSRVLGLVIAMEALPVMVPYVRLVTVIRTHHCCLPRMRKPNLRAFFSLLSLGIDKVLVGIMC